MPTKSAHKNNENPLFAQGSKWDFFLSPEGFKKYLQEKHIFAICYFVFAF